LLWNEQNRGTDERDLFIKQKGQGQVSRD